MYLRNPDSQHGAALFIALVFLVIITLISITAMRTSTMELLMATNEQERRIALDATQSATAKVANSSLIRIGAEGEKTCFGFGYTPATNPITGVNDCDRTENIPAGSGYDADTFVAVTMRGTGTCPPAMASSAKGGTSLTVSAGTTAQGGCIYFNMETLHDATDKRRGRAETQEGFIRIGF